MAETGPEFHHGDQDASANLASYRLFLDLAKWSALHLAVLTLVLVLWFCTNAGFWGGLVPGVILTALGTWFLRRRPASEH